MRTFLIPLLVVLLSAAVTLAASGPEVVKAGIYPTTITPGEQFTVYAQVTHPNGADSIGTVGLIYDNQLVLALPKSSASGVYYQTLTAPADCPSGVFPLDIAALDNDLQVSNVIHFVFSVLGNDPVTLISPDNGAKYGCYEAPEFSWAPYSEAIGYAFEIFLPIGVSAVINLPAEITSIPIPLAVWNIVPEGDYSWQVGAVMGEGMPADHWSEIYSLTKDCSSGPRSEFTGIIAGIDPTNLILTVQTSDDPSQEIPVQVTADTAIADENGNPLTFDALAVGMSVDVTGEQGTDPGAPFVAASITVFNATPPAHAFGNIVSLDAATLTFVMDNHESGDQQVTVQVTDQTQIFGTMGQPLNFNDLAVGMLAIVNGQLQGEVLVAQLIRVFDQPPPPPPPPPVLEGAIISIDPTALQLLVAPSDGSDNVTVQVTADTSIHDLLGTPLSFTDLTTGMNVRVIGEVQNTILMAIEITVESFTPPPPPQTHISGVITAVDPETLQFQMLALGFLHITVQTTADTMITDDAGTPLTFGDLAIDQSVTAYGQTENDLFTASQVVVHNSSPTPTPTPPPGSQVDGNIRAVVADKQQLQVELNGNGSDVVTVQVEPDTVITDKDGNPLTFDDLAVGEHIAATGEYHDVLFVAQTITVFDSGPTPTPPVQISGIIHSIDADDMQFEVSAGHSLCHTRVQVSDTTQIADDQGNPLTFDDLQVGDNVLVGGVWDDEMLDAASVTVYNSEPPPPPPPSQISGVIVEIEEWEWEFTVSGSNGHDRFAVQVTDNTVITDNNGNELSFEDLQEGQAVLVTGSWDDEQLYADTVVVSDYTPPPPPQENIQGRIDSIDAEAMTIALQTGWGHGGLTTVQVTDSTQITDREGNELSFADLEANDWLMGLGSYDNDVFVAAMLMVYRY